MEGTAVARVTYKRMRPQCLGVIGCDCKCDGCEMPALVREMDEVTEGMVIQTDGGSYTLKVLRPKPEDYTMYYCNKCKGWHRKDSMIGIRHRKHEKKD